LDVLSRTQARTLEEARTSLDLHEAYLQGANLRGANFQEAILPGANLQEAILRGANLQEAILLDAILRGADLQEADLQDAILQDAILQEADLTRAKGITNEELDQQARSLDGVTMPNGQKYEDWLKSKGRKENGENE